MGLETAAAVGLGGAVLGGLGGAMGSKQTQSSTSAPWAPQQDYLKYGFSQAKDAVGNALNMGTYGGQRVAALNPFQTQGANTVAGYTDAYGNNLANLTGAAAQGMLNAGQGFGTNAQNLFNQYANNDATQSILGAAAQYADNPYVNGVIDAAGRDVTRQLSEQVLPGQARAAAGTGNSNNTRAGVQQAIAQRGAADRLSDISSNIRSQFFNTGLGMAQNQYNQNLQNSLAANNQLLSAYNGGMSGAGTSQNLAAGNFDAMNAAGGLYQNQNQAELDAQRAAFGEQQNNSLDLLAKYQALVNGNYGGTSTGVTSTGGGFGGALSGALGGGLGALGTVGKLKGTGVFGL
jgi:hypothetical protein